MFRSQSEEPRIAILSEHDMPVDADNIRRDVTLSVIIEKTEQIDSDYVLCSKIKIK